MPATHALIGGGSGFVGSRLCKLLRSSGTHVTVISRMPGPNRLTWHELKNNGLPSETTAVINLAGQNVLDAKQRWTEGFKQNVWNSRVNTTKTLAEAITKAEKKPNVFITMSGVGYYKPCHSTEYTEESPGGDFDFLSRLATSWEAAAKLDDNSVRQVTLRSGVVLGREGGMISQLYLPFYLGLGGPIGSGLQYLPWIHVQDLVKFIAFAIENPKVKGIYNLVAPEIITNLQFSKTFAKTLSRPACIPVPEFVLNAVFSKERAKIMTEGQRVIPKRTLESGFEFDYPDIQSACKECVNSKR